MKACRLALSALVFGAALLAPARAQLIHLAFTEGRENNMIFRADSPMIPWNHTGGYISRFDLWYDASAPTDPTRNVWRADVFAHGLGNFEIVRPHDGLSFFDGNLHLIYATETGPYETLEFDAQVVGDATSDGSPPVPPFSISSYSLYLEGGSSYFDVPHFASGYGNGAFDKLTISVEQSVVLHPVPEPATYGLGAAALLGVAVIVARRRRSPAGQPA